MISISSKTIYHAFSYHGYMCGCSTSSMLVCKRFFEEAFQILSQSLYSHTCVTESVHNPDCNLPCPLCADCNLTLGSRGIEGCAELGRDDADFEESEEDHGLIAMAMKYSDERRIQAQVVGSIVLLTILLKIC